MDIHPDPPPPTPLGGVPLHPSGVLPTDPSATQLPPCLLVSPTANTLADTLGAPPLYKKQETARWNAAAHSYRSSRAVSQELPFIFPETGHEQLNVLANKDIKTSSRTPVSLEDIANMNRKRHDEVGGRVTEEWDGLLELEAIAAVKELELEVQDISFSEMLPRTSDLIFVNMKTQEGQPYTLELTMKGWRIASLRSDCMNGDYTKVDLHIRYYRNARDLLNVVSPDHATRFNECVAKKLEMLAAKDHSPAVAAH